MMLKTTIVAGIVLSAVSIFGQNIGINSTGVNPDNSAMLDVVSSNRGLLVPRVQLTATNAAGPITTPTTSLLVYNIAAAGAGVTAVTAGYYYNAGTSGAPNWKRVSTDGDHWKVDGNAGTTASTSGYGGAAANNNFIGTTDAVDYVFATNGLEKMRIKSDGTTMARIGIGTAFTSNLNGATPSLFHLHDWGTSATDMPIVQLSTANTASGRTVGIVNFASTGTSNEKRVATIESYLTAASGTNASGDLRFFTNNNNTLEEKLRLSTTEAVFNEQSIDYDFRVESNGFDDIFFVDAGNDRVGFFNNTPTYPIHGLVSHATYGMRVDNTDAGGVAVYCRNTAAAGAGGGDGVLGRTSQTSGFGVYGLNDNTSGTGMYIRGQNAAGSFLAAGSGASISGTSIGTWSRATGTNSVGIIGCGDGEAAFSLVGVSQGGSFIGADIGVYGFANSTANGDGGGYFANNGSAYAYVGYRFGGTNYKIYGVGTVSTSVKDVNEKDITMFCPEAPEVLFQDYGVGKLKNGNCHISIDPNFSKNITVNEKHPLRVFIQLKGDCNGVYVTNENNEGFDVVELMKGHSNAEFYWSITANRRDENHPEDGGKTNYEDVRFPFGPGKIANSEYQSSEEDDEK